MFTRSVPAHPRTLAACTLVAAALTFVLVLFSGRPGAVQRAAAATPGPITSGLVNPALFKLLIPQPDLAVLQPYPWDGQGRQQFTLINQGDGAAGAFHVAVLAASDSYGFDVAGLPAHGYLNVALTFTPACGQSIVVVADVGNRLPDATLADNVLTFYGACNW